jgi:hypothetical protein
MLGRDQQEKEDNAKGLPIQRATGWLIAGSLLSNLLHFLLWMVPAALLLQKLQPQLPNRYPICNQRQLPIPLIRHSHKTVCHKPACHKPARHKPVGHKLGCNAKNSVLDQQ